MFEDELGEVGGRVRSAGFAPVGGDAELAEAEGESRELMPVASR
jgi:hypothetical protein